MTFGNQLREKKEEIVQRWLDDALAAYPRDGAAAFRRQKDRFANPVGHSLRQGLRGAVEAILGEDDGEGMGPHLREIIRIRAIQSFSPSEAVGFVFRLKEAVRAELGGAAAEGRFASDLAKLDRRIDQSALDVFDLFMECRERVCELRVNEVKRRVSWIMKKLDQRAAEFEPLSEPPGARASEGMNARREGPQ